MGEPLRHPETMAQMARACELGGAGGIRCQGLSDIAAIKGRTEVPVIGIWKEGHEGVYITPTLRHARACVMAGADIVAVDATDRPRPDGKTLEEHGDAAEGRGRAGDGRLRHHRGHPPRIRHRLRHCVHYAVAPRRRHRLRHGRAARTWRWCARRCPSSRTSRLSAKVACTRRPMRRPPWTPAPGPWWWAPPSRTPRPSPAGSWKPQASKPEIAKPRPVRGFFMCKGKSSRTGGLSGVQVAQTVLAW